MTAVNNSRWVKGNPRYDSKTKETIERKYRRLYKDENGRTWHQGASIRPVFKVR